MPYRERLNNVNEAKRITESFGYSSTGEATSSITDIFATLSGTNSQLTTMTVGEALAAANPQPGDIVKSQTGVAMYGNYGWEGSLKAMEGGGDECRGASRAGSRGLYYLVISGEGAGQAMTLRTCIDGEIIDIDNTQTFVSDDNIGTSWNPYVIDLSNVLTGITVVNGSPVDDSDWWTLQGYKIGRKPTQPGVYIHHGKKVTIKRKK